MSRPVITVTSGADVDADHQADTGVHRFPASTPGSATDAHGFGMGVFGTGTFGA